MLEVDLQNKGTKHAKIFKNVTFFFWKIEKKAIS